MATLGALAGPAQAAPGDIFTFAGTGSPAFAGDGGPAGSAALNRPTGIAWLRDGSVLVAEFDNHRVRKISPSGVISTVAGTGTAGFSGDGGAATNARLNSPTDVDATVDGGFLIADLGNRRVRKVSAGGTISTVAGNGVDGSSGDGGAATSAALSAPAGVASRATGGFLIADAGGDRVRAVSPGGTISTVAGGGAGDGDSGPATSARLDGPGGVAVLPDGGFLVAEYLGHAVRRVSAAGRITRVAGTGTAGFSGDGGAARAARVDHPVGVSPTADGGFLIGDSESGRVRKVMPDGTIVSVAGIGVDGYAGDGGPAAVARLNLPYAALETSNGGILIADGGNHRLRQIEGRAPEAWEPTPGGGPPVEAPWLKPPARVLQVSGNGTVRIQVGCPVTAAAPCRGTIRLVLRASARKRVAAAARSLVIAQTRFSVAPGRQQAVKLRLTRQARKLLRKRRKLTVRAVVARRGGPNIGERSQSVTIKPKKKRRRRHG